jgi:hypothetical protein
VGLGSIFLGNWHTMLVNLFYSCLSFKSRNIQWVWSLFAVPLLFFPQDHQLHSECFIAQFKFSFYLVEKLSISIWRFSALVNFILKRYWKSYAVVFFYLRAYLSLFYVVLMLAHLYFWVSNLYMSYCWFLLHIGSCPEMEMSIWRKFLITINLVLC